MLNHHLSSNVSKGLWAGAIGLMSYGAIAASAYGQEMPSLELIQLQTELQGAVCKQDWAAAAAFAGELMEGEELSESDRAMMTDLEDRFQQLAIDEEAFDTLPNCVTLELPGSGDDTAFESLLTPVLPFLAEESVELLEELGSTNNLRMMLGLCSLMENPEVQTSVDLAMATVERHFFGLPLTQTDTFEDLYDEDSYDLENTLAEYFGVLGVSGAIHFCPENAEKAESLFGVPIASILEQYQQRQPQQTAPLEQ